MNAIKVLMVTVTLGKESGVNTFIMNYFRKTDHAKIRIDVLSYLESPDQSEYAAEITAGGGRIFFTPPVKRFQEHIRFLKRLIRDGQYDIIHDNSLIMTLPLMMICRRNRIPVRILHSHSSRYGEPGYKEWRNRLFHPFLRACCTDFLACSKAAGENIFGNRRYTVLPNVINGSVFTFSEETRAMIREQEKLDGKIVVLTSGRASAEKNPLFALELMQRVIEKHDNVVYWWVGDGPMKDAMEIRARELGLGDHLVLWGKQSDMTAFYHAADIFLLPSLFEGLPYTGVEAQAMGLPCLVSAAVTEEMVYTDLVRFVSLEEPAGNWCEAMEALFSRIPLRRSYAAELVDSPFSDTDAGSMLEELYVQMLEKNRRRRAR